MERVALTLAGRYQHVHITIRDRSGENPALDGDHRFTASARPRGHGEGACAPHPLCLLQRGVSRPHARRSSRAPTPTPRANCRTRSSPIRRSARSSPAPTRSGPVASCPSGRRSQWSVGFFRTDLEDDLLFTTVQTGGSGFFQNVDRTRRQGVEAGVSGTWDRLKYFLNYAYVDATYETDTTLASVTAADGVRVQAGDRIPGVPAAQPQARGRRSPSSRTSGLVGT